MNTINIYNELKNLDEEAYTSLQRKQGDISSLFPPFASRVKMVGTSGGSHMADSRPPDTWHFRIASATTQGKKYNAYIRFKNIEDELKLGVEEKDNWTKDGQHVDYRKLAADLLANVDVEVGCSCPADLYWGGKYIRTQRGSNYGDDENRAPVKRNPREHGAYCKHLHLMLQTLPFYHGDMAKFLKTFYAEEITKLEKGENEPEKPTKPEPSKAEPKIKDEPKKEEPTAKIKKEVEKPVQKEEEPKKEEKPVEKPEKLKPEKEEPENDEEPKDSEKEKDIKNKKKKTDKDKPDEEEEPK